MNIISLLPLLASLAYIPLVIITLTTRPWQKHHIFIVLYLIAAMIWSLCSFFIRIYFFLDYKLLLFRFTMVFFIWFVVQYFFFIRYFLYKSAGWGTYFGYVTLFVVALGAIMGYWPQTLVVEHGTVSPSLGIWLLPMVVIPIILAIYLLYMLARRFKSSTDPVERNRLLYLFITVGLLCLFGIINSTPLGNQFPTAQIGHFLNAALLT